MLNSLHHLGFLRSSSSGKAEFLAAGYEEAKSNIREDVFGVTNSMLVRQGLPSIEIVVPDDPISSSGRHLDTSLPHHMCFEVTDIYEVRSDLIANGAKALSDVVVSNLHNRTICFVHLRGLGLIELISNSDEHFQL